MANLKSQLKGVVIKIVLGGFCLFIAISFFIGFDPGKQTGHTFFNMAMRILQILPAAFVLIGLFEVWIKDETVKNHLGETAGLKGHLWAIMLAGMMVGPLYVSFPVANAILQKGARIGVVLTYIGASAICRIPMAIFEASFLGIQFTMVRLVVSLPLVLFSSIALEKWYGHREIFRPPDNHK